MIAVFESTTFVTRLIEGEFFNVDNVITKDYSTKIKINKKDLSGFQIFPGSGKKASG